MRVKEKTRARTPCIDKKWLFYCTINSTHEYLIYYLSFQKLRRFLPLKRLHIHLFMGNIVNLSPEIDFARNFVYSSFILRSIDNLRQQILPTKSSLMKCTRQTTRFVLVNKNYNVRRHDQVNKSPCVCVCGGGLPPSSKNCYQH